MEINEKKLPTASAEHEPTLEERLRKSLLVGMGRVNHTWGNAESIPGQLMVRLAWATAKIPPAVRAIGSMFKSIFDRAASLFGISGQPGHQQSVIQPGEMKEPGKTVDREHTIDLELNNDLMPLLEGPVATPEDKSFALVLNQHRDDVPLDKNGREFYRFFEQENDLDEMTEKTILDAWEHAKNSHGSEFRDYISHYDFLRKTPEMTAILQSTLADRLDRPVPLGQPATDQFINKLKSVISYDGTGNLPEALKIGLNSSDEMAVAMVSASLAYTVGVSPGGLESTRKALAEFISSNNLEAELTEPLFISQLLQDKQVREALIDHLESLHEPLPESALPLPPESDINTEYNEIPSSVDRDSILEILQGQSEFEQHANSPLKGPDQEMEGEKASGRSISKEVSISPISSAEPSI